MRWFRIIITAFLIALVESTLLQGAGVEGVRPDLAFIYVFFLALNSAPDQGFIAFWIVGLMKDLFSGGPLGAYALIFAACGYQVSALTQKLYKQNPLIQILVALPAVTAANALYVAGMFFTYPHLPLSSVAKTGLICILYTTALIPPLLFFMSKMKPLLGICPPSPRVPREEPEAAE